MAKPPPTPPRKTTLPGFESQPDLEEHRHHHHHELDRAVRELILVIARLAQEIPMSNLTDRVTASVTAALPLIGATTADAQSISNDMDRLDAAVAKANTPGTNPNVIDTITDVQGTAPNFDVTVTDASRFSAGQVLVSKAVPNGPLDTGTARVVAASTSRPNTISLQTSDGWTPVTGHAIGVSGVLFGDPVVATPAPAAFRSR